jgi:hypothetical protein
LVALSKVRSKKFFFKKKNQKTFAPLRAVQPRHVLLFINDRASTMSVQEQSVFASRLQAI